MSETGIRLSPFCAKLRSKKVFFLEAPPREESDIFDASNACWCARTGTAVGEDGEVVHPEDCRSGRKCFEPYGSPA